MQLGITAFNFAKMPSLGNAIFNTAEIVAFLMQLETDRSDEFVHAFFLDGTGRLTWSETVTEGQADQALVNYRALIGMALRLNATGLILSHNHPSGVAKPSPRDVTSTLELERVCAKIGIALLDHLIVASGGCFSFRAEGILRRMK